jgi:hypothetical protein
VVLVGEHNEIGDRLKVAIELGAEAFLELACAGGRSSPRA